MQTVEKKINSTIIGKDCYDMIFTKIDKVIIEHNSLEVHKGEYLDEDCVLLMVVLLLLEEANKLYSICEDKEDKAILEKAIYRLYQRVNGGGKNGYKRNKGRNSKKYPKNRRTR